MVANGIKASSVFLEDDTAAVLFIVKFFTANFSRQLARHVIAFRQFNIRLPTVNVQVQKMAYVTRIPVDVIVNPSKVIGGYWVLHGVYPVIGTIAATAHNIGSSWNCGLISFPSFIKLLGNAQVMHR
tara:strand:+ start:368 stop:748 length:381 start_codon:yes stop_codon:yes gene_type:complete